MYSFIENSNSEANNIFNNINPNLLYCIKDTSKATNIISLLNTKNAINNCCNDCFFKNVTYIPEEEICIQNCDNYEYKYRYNNKCFTSCNNFYSFDQKECIDLIPEGYYLNSSSLKTIDKCPVKCESCSYESMTNNLCTSCKNSYLKIDIDSFCDCIINCPEGYIYKNNTCEISYEIVNCTENDDYILVSNHSCIDKCNSINFLNNICEGKNNNFEIKNNIINNIRKDIVDGNLNSLLENVTNNQKLDIEIFQDDIKYQITSSFNQDNKKYNNISIIKLKECEKRLKSDNGLDEDDSLIIFKVDLYEEGLLMPIIEYEVYHPYTHKRLNLYICDNAIDISFPVSIEENKLYKYNSSSDFYNDKCYPYTSENGTDVTLSDRQLDYVNNNLSLCETNCKLIEYNNKTKYALCLCEIKNEIKITEDIIIDKDKLLKGFIDIKSMMNLVVLKCYYVLFTADGLLNNIGSFVLIFIIFIFIVSIFIFLFKGYNSLLNKIIWIISLTKGNNKKNYLQIKMKNKLHYVEIIKIIHMYSANYFK
jgi:hypothetical protein